MIKTEWNELKAEAARLHAHIDTEWAEDHEIEYTAFLDCLETLYAEGQLTAEEYDEIAGEAFYDFEPKTK